MKGRESGMPDEVQWSSFFDARKAIEILLGAEGVDGDLVEFGCGYGTFTFVAASRTRGTVTALDIDPYLVALTQSQADKLLLPNVRAQVRDFVAQGTGLETGTQSHAMIFNLLHLEQPVALLLEARRVLRPEGRVSVIHWRSDIPTPRGPSLAIRPRPEQCQAWLEEAGFHDVSHVDLQQCCPYHFGLVAHG